MNKDATKFGILVVEDNLGDFVLIEDYLEEQILAPQIMHLKTFSEAQQLFKNNKINFDVILLDLTLPDMSREALISEMILMAKGIPIIVLTGFSDVDFGTKSLSLGVADYLLKDDITSTSLYKNIIYTIERKKKKLELEESEQRYSDLFHLSPQPMWVYEFDSLKFQDVNNAAIEHYGYSRDEFLSMTVNEINISSQEIASICKHKKKNGEIIQVECKQNSILFKGKKANLVIVNDITKITNYINTIENQNTKLQEIAWMQSHVVRAPLARMMGLIDLIQDESITESEKSDLLENLLGSAFELDKIIREISSKTHEAKVSETKKIDF